MKSRPVGVAMIHEDDEAINPYLQLFCEDVSKIHSNINRKV
jgi:hypothetical protein